MSYMSLLPELFPYGVNVTDEDAQNMVYNLLWEAPKEFVPNGSSFCVTTDCETGRKNLWLSEASYKVLLRVGVISQDEVPPYQVLGKEDKVGEGQERSTPRT